MLSQRQSLTHSRVNPNYQTRILNLQHIITQRKCKLSIKRLGKSFNLPFIVVEVSSPAILSADPSTQLKFVKRIMSVNHRTTDFFSEYSNCFGELGLLPKKRHVRVKSDVSPVIRSSRRIYLALRDKVDIELDKMLKLTIIVPVNEPTKWVNQLVVTEKANGKLICLDPRNLNEAILRDRYEMSTAERLFSEMSDTKFFTKLDCSNCY